MQAAQFVTTSLELHLFFGRIMKEHSLFLQAGFTPAGENFSKEAAGFRKSFEELLSQAVHLANGVVRPQVLASGEVVTEFTALAERQTEGFTAIPINRELTQRELRLRPGPGEGTGRVEPVRQINRRALNLLDGLIGLKERILKNVLDCRLFTVNYPLLIEHILREAKLYRSYVQSLERTGRLPEQTMQEVECFWNQIMMEHAQFIRGLLDPTETALYAAADGFAGAYGKLLEACDTAQRRTMGSRAQSLDETVRFRDFKQSGTQGIQQCRIRSVILPLLADHVLREANHYIRLLKK